jgi:hypothetical protein
MRRRIRRIAKLAAVAVLAAATTTPVAAAQVTSERAGDVDGQQVCRNWERAVRLSLAYGGISGEQADSYLASRADDPCGVAPLTPRSLFHAGDPA